MRGTEMGRQWCGQRGLGARRRGEVGEGGEEAADAQHALRKSKREARRRFAKSRARAGGAVAKV